MQASGQRLFVYKAGRNWTCVCTRCWTCVAASRRRKVIEAAISAHTCSAEEAGSAETLKPFRRSYFPPRILATFCNYCSESFFTPKYTVILMIERIHRCPGIKKASEKRSGSQ